MTTAETVGVVIGTFGDNSWERLARERAFPSVTQQTRKADMVCLVHRDTLAQARNDGLRSLQTTWAIFLDADDALAPGYIEAMLAGSGDLRQPSTVGVYEDGTEDDAAILIPSRPLIDGNYIVIGAMVRRQLLVDVGGFQEWPVAEEWEAWIRCVLAGGVIGAAPQAVYRVHVNPSGRNSAPATVQGQVWRQVRELHGEAWRRMEGAA